MRFHKFYFYSLIFCVLSFLIFSNSSTAQIKKQKSKAEQMRDAKKNKINYNINAVFGARYRYFVSNSSIKCGFIEDTLKIKNRIKFFHEFQLRYLGGKSAKIVWCPFRVSYFLGKTETSTIQSLQIGIPFLFLTPNYDFLFAKRESIEIEGKAGEMWGRTNENYFRVGIYSFNFSLRFHIKEYYVLGFVTGYSFIGNYKKEKEIEDINHQIVKKTFEIKFTNNWHYGISVEIPIRKSKHDFFTVHF